MTNLAGKNRLRQKTTIARVAGVGLASALLGLLLGAQPATADPPASQTIDFSSSGYTVGAGKPVGQNGWTGQSGLDDALVANSSFPSSGLPAGTSLRFSNAVLTSGFGQLLTPTVAFAGETSTGATNNTFTAHYTIASATGGYQDGLGIEVDVSWGGNRAGGALLFRHLDGGLQISTTWMPSDGQNDDVSSWRSMVLAGPLPGGLWDPTVPHTISTVTHSSTMARTSPKSRSIRHPS
ncbi:MAG: hypothetical protein WDM88_11645 [Galbitalea sp.]